MFLKHEKIYLFLYISFAKLEGETGHGVTHNKYGRTAYCDRFIQLDYKKECFDVVMKYCAHLLRIWAIYFMTSAGFFCEIGFTNQ
jgi:hypothetical protein